MADSTNTEMKLATAKEKKEVADQAFKQGDVKAALTSYHQSLLYLLGLDKNALQSLGVGPSASAPFGTKDKDEKDSKEKTEVDDIIEKVYSNMAACHIKNKNWKRAIESADKALAKNENNFKAIFRKAKALGEEGFYESAVKLLNEVKDKNPSDAAIVDVELIRLKAIDDERTRAHRQRFKGFLNKAEKKLTSEDAEPT